MSALEASVVGRDGVVQFAGPDKEASYSPWKNFYGNLVVIRHAHVMYTLYAHLSKIDVQAGNEVKAGDLIGEVGQSGVATGSHLHFEVRKGGDGMDYSSTQNPEIWLVPNKDEDGDLFGAISFSIVDEVSSFRFVEFTARYHKDENGPKVKSHYVVNWLTVLTGSGVKRAQALFSEKERKGLDNGQGRHDHGPPCLRDNRTDRRGPC